MPQLRRKYLRRGGEDPGDEGVNSGNSSLRYVNEDISLLEPPRIKSLKSTGYTMFPGMVEQIIGRVVALMGILLQV